VVFGQWAVGKTVLCRRYEDDQFHEEVTMTCGFDFVTKREHVNGTDVTLTIVDIAGQDRFFSRIQRLPSCFGGVSGGLAVFSLADPGTANELPKYFAALDTKLKEEGRESVPIIVVGNKADIRTVGSDYGEEFATRNGMKYMETSAKTGQGVHEVFSAIAELVVTNYLTKSSSEGEASTVAPVQIEKLSARERKE
jgi:small GTP-binding protein